MKNRNYFRLKVLDDGQIDAMHNPSLNSELEEMCYDEIIGTVDEIGIRTVD